jgi:hypothetical protein
MNRSARPARRQVTEPLPIRREPDDRESGSAGGRAEKDQPTLAPRRAAHPSAWHNSFNKLQRCYERKEKVINAFFDLGDAIITVRRLIRESWTLYRWDSRPANRP